MPLRLYNTLSRQKETFTPPPPAEVRMYHCGPTVYDVAHIGNLRAYVFADLLRRTLEYLGYTVRQVVNITDVGQLTSDADEGEDKMSKALRREGKPFTLEAMHKLALRYEQVFVEDLATLNIKNPHFLPRASEHVSEDIEFIQTLEKKAAAYRINDGIYFDTSKFPAYGKLGGVKVDNQRAGARIAVNPEKRNASDFTLWKLARGAVGWKSPWGLGFPGWHIECSVMSEKYLSPIPFDIHTGGIEHIPVHHQNEVAQTETARGISLARFWLHTAHVTIGGGKMAKSKGNVLTLRDLTERRVDPLAYRLWLLGTHYRMTASFDDEAIEGAQNAYENLTRGISSLEAPDTGTILPSYKVRFTAALEDDLGSPQALAVLWEMLRDQSTAPKDRRATALNFDRVLGLGLDRPIWSGEIPPEVQTLKEKRDEARSTKNFTLADSLRQQIEAAGFEVEDTSDGSRLRPLR